MNILKTIYRFVSQRVWRFYLQGEMQKLLLAAHDDSAVAVMMMKLNGMMDRWLFMNFIG